MLPRQLHSLLLAVPLVGAQYVVDQLSFGHQSSLSPNGRGIPGWHVSGSNHQVQLLSDRIVLTPPVPGSTRGSLWTETPIESGDWTAEFDFRASGQDQGSGNIQMWYAKDKGQIGDGSVYTVGNFDGLALVIDQYGGRGGGIRGFLNDGSQNYKGHSSLESLAFGHCDYAYRNLGRPSKVKIQNRNGLTVSVDDRVCFRSDRITLPSGYYFGITAATAENPDSFEVSRFVVSTGTPSAPQHLNSPEARSGKPPAIEKLDRWPGSPEILPDAQPEEIQSQTDQFADLHNRLQGLTHQIANIFGEFDRLSRTLDQRHSELMGGMPNIPPDTFQQLNKRVENIERTLQTVQRDVEGRDYKEHLSNLQQAVEGVRGGLTDHLPDTIGRSKSRNQISIFPMNHADNVFQWSRTPRRAWASLSS